MEGSTQKVGGFYRIMSTSRVVPRKRIFVPGYSCYILGFFCIFEENANVAPRSSAKQIFNAWGSPIV